MDPMRAVQKVLQTAHERHGAKPMKDARGEMDCPLCGKGLRYTISCLNGHVWALCATKGCISFMQ